ncbi:uncharacterized protein BX663DRAFT_513515 [Cokeromyces recurvatus]|uniref:uncharacterized protein n=1 Tax=Cokeromyces recurvatus TaxID=90255 RepID=UPI00221EDDC1|nr:uncharacterized protein BX663DRAFT_513515 [Cokeromyces recurvatus]KAI7901640.1 hypothetical protein BX663DRAFT_513515 [Cokeromyces recurvatus]
MLVESEPLKSSSASSRSLPIMGLESYPPLLRKKTSESDRSMMAVTKTENYASEKELVETNENAKKPSSTHSRSRSITSLFTRQRRPSITRTHSQLSIPDIMTSSKAKSKPLIKFISFFPLKSNNKSSSSLSPKSTLSEKSLEFEALLEQYPSRTIKTSLTPCTAA